MKTLLLLAIFILTQIVSCNVDDQHVRRGDDKYSRGDFEGAIIDYTNAIDINPGNAVAYNNRGNARKGLELYREAIADYSRAAEIKPMAVTYYNRGTVKYKLGDYRGAIEDFSTSIDMQSEYAKAYMTRGNAHFAISETDNACWDWSRAGNYGYHDAYDLINKHCN